METAAGTRYLEEVEALYLALRGKGLMISPADAAVVARWEADGIPLALACRAVRASLRARAARESFPPLRWCDGAVREAASRTRGAAGAAGGREPERSAPAERESRAPGKAERGAAIEPGGAAERRRARALGRALAELVHSLPRDARSAALRRSYEEAFRIVTEAAGATVREASRERAAGTAGAAALLAAVTRADREVCRAALACLPARERAAVQAKAAEAERRARGRSSPRGLSALRHEIVGRELERLGLVRPLSLLGNAPPRAGARGSR